MTRVSGQMHLDNASRQYVTAAGERRASRCFLLRRSYRDENGQPRNETVANLSALPDRMIGALKEMLKGATLVEAGSAFDVERSVPHGNAAAAHVMASKLGLRKLLGPPCRERDIAYALVLSRALRPESKLSTLGWWASGDTTLAADLGVAGAGTDDVYAAMDWLVSRQCDIEKRLAGRYPRQGGTAMSGLSSWWLEGSLDNRVRGHVLICMLAAYLSWHLRDALAELTGAGQDTYGDFPDLLDHLSTLDRQIITFTGGQQIEKLTSPTPVQRRAFELLGAPVPLTLQ